VLQGLSGSTTGARSDTVTAESGKKTFFGTCDAVRQVAAILARWSWANRSEALWSGARLASLYIGRALLVVGGSWMERDTAERDAVLVLLWPNRPWRRRTVRINHCDLARMHIVSAV